VLQGPKKQCACFAGNFLTAQGRLSEAAQVMDSSVSAASGTPDYDALLAAAGAHRHAKSYDKAELYYRRAVLLKPDVRIMGIWVKKEYLWDAYLLWIKLLIVVGSSASEAVNIFQLVFRFGDSSNVWVV